MRCHFQTRVMSMYLVIFRSFSHNPGSGLAGVLALANMHIKLLVDRSSRLHQFADNMTIRWKLFAAVLTNSKHWYTGSFLYDSEATFRHAG